MLCCVCGVIWRGVVRCGGAHEGKHFSQLKNALFLNSCGFLDLTEVHSYVQVALVHGAIGECGDSAFPGKT